MPREGIGPPTPASSKANLDYLIFVLLKARCEVGRCLQDYCWDSLASLYTFPPTFALTDLARDCLVFWILSFPRIHPIIQSVLLQKAPKILGLRSTNELPRRYLIAIKSYKKNNKGAMPLLFFVIASLRSNLLPFRHCEVLRGNLYFILYTLYFLLITP